MKLSGLELILQKVYDFDDPKPQLEQYLTPATIAAEVVYRAYMLGDLNDKRVADLGCGTGMLGIGAAILGGKVVGIDVDENAIKKAKKFCKENSISAEFLCMDVKDFNEKVDTVIMNPPFGSQKKHADREFLKKACEIAKVIYHIHLKETEEFVMNHYRKRANKVMKLAEYSFPLKHRFTFHKKQKIEYKINLLRVEV